MAFYILFSLLSFSLFVLIGSIAGASILSILGIKYNFSFSVLGRWLCIVLVLAFVVNHFYGNVFYIYFK